jgi:hypothetical protein
VVAQNVQFLGSPGGGQGKGAPEGASAAGAEGIDDDTPF